MIYVGCHIVVAMFQTLISEGWVSLRTLAWTLPCVIVFYYWADYAFMSYRIRKSAGVRAPSLASNPITGKALRGPCFASRISFFYLREEIVADTR